ncbi:endonuclease [Bacillus wiedmannii]|uniref:AAA family ATPase n=1 Tax=Bacillus cereus group TaxID=86661 RepID=UPI0011ED0EBC|nr:MULTISPECIES: AAA family ATPase [Bacillus cereus group]KAA0795293.1 endonuclease [Bacillus sp. BB081]QWH74213.1 endonuclease [Bacillus wiedmannii]
MKLEWVRIKDFRSIEDTGRIYVDSNLTVLAGQNESGKSNVLKALEAFSTSQFLGGDYPEGKERTASDPTVEISFIVKSEDIKRYLKASVYHSEFFSEGSYSFTIRKSLVTQKYYTYGSIQNVFFNKKNLELIRDIVEELNSHIERFSTRGYLEDIPDSGGMADFVIEDAQEFLEAFPKIEDPIEWLRSFKSDLEQFFGIKIIRAPDEEELGIYKISVDAENPNSDNDFIRDSLIDFDRSIRNYEEFEKSFKIPRFKMLESFEKTLPDSIELVLNEKDIWSSYVNQVLGGESILHTQDISNRTLKRKMMDVSNEITLLFQSIYTQSQIKLELDVGTNNTLNFYIYDGGNDIDFLPSQRSKGFQWFLSFFFAINSVKGEGSIILIDEPGPYLHPKAQKDVLKALEVLTESNQIIFTTHSPYLINPNNLERIRLVSRDNKNCTIVENKIHASSKAKKEVYTPIITAIGLDLSGAFGTFGEYNTIVEGISDYFYLECMKKYVDNIEKFGEMRFIPSIGASNIDNLASLLKGWGVDFKVLLDNDKAGRDEQKELKKELILSDEQLIFVSDEPGHAIEDLFSREDFLKYVIPDLDVSEQDKELKNSSLFKGKSKALFAKMFKEKFQKETDIKFTSQTINNFTNLFHKLYGVSDVRAEVMESVR